MIPIGGPKVKNFGKIEFEQNRKTPFEPLAGQKGF
jgi:hypothetical protein